jgi:5-(carboxyamino)imidazole ribonucleotide mutase
MGSRSDLPVMQPAADALAELGIAHEVRVVSAHRTPDHMVDFARAATARGIQVLIAGAGGAAHLPGMLAALCTLPVIGVPVPLKYLDGLDSLLSMVQMPAGVPVATVAVGNARNAGLLAARILAVGDPELRLALDRLAATAADRSLADDRSLAANRSVDADRSLAANRSVDADRSLADKLSVDAPRSLAGKLSVDADRSHAGRPEDSGS